MRIDLENSSREFVDLIGSDLVVDGDFYSNPILVHNGRFECEVFAGYSKPRRSNVYVIKRYESKSGKSPRWFVYSRNDGVRYNPHNNIKDLTIFALDVKETSVGTKYKCSKCDVEREVRKKLGLARRD
jgi:hypothetical protein